MTCVVMVIVATPLPFKLPDPSVCPSTEIVTLPVIGPAPGSAGVTVAVTVKGWWPYLWREWLTSVDHKRIGVMYVTLGLVMLLRGFSAATGRRLTCWEG